MPALAFLKVEGLGNDFLLLDRLDLVGADLDAELSRLRHLAPRLCDRRTGVGADGILVVAGPSAHENDARMIVINHDGSRPEMCGNGVRCVAQMIASRTQTRAARIETDAGVRECEILTGDEASARVSVTMGPARTLARRELDLEGPREFVDVSMGNPHAICFVRDDEDPEALARRFGPLVEVDPAYPDRTNVEFAHFDGDAIVLWVWERGCGITGACGTGACATAAAAVAAGRAEPDRALRVRLPGGELEITVPAQPGAEVRMTGPARAVFTGSVELEPLEPAR